MTWSGPGLPKGTLPNTPGALARLEALLVPHHTLVGANSGAPTPVDWAVGFSDQGSNSDCEAHGKEKMVFGTAKAGGYAGARGDLFGIYAFRAEDFPELPLSSPLPDAGAIDATITAGLARFGVLAAGDGPRAIGDRLDVLQLEQAAGLRVPAVARIELAGEDLVAALLRALARGCASFVMQVDTSYEALTNDQVWKGPSGKVLGGHCQAIDAWRWGTNGVELGVEGSWGPQFGRVWIPAQVFGRVATAVTIASVVPKLAAAPGGLS